MNNRGFSLTELVSGMAILCVLGGIALPSLKDWKVEEELRECVSNLVCEMFHARGTAVKEDSYVVLTYTESGFRTFNDNGNDGGIKGDWVQQENEKTLAEITLPKTIRIETAKSTFTLDRTRFSGGVGVKAGSIVLMAANGSESKVVLSSVGRIRTQKL